MMSDRVRALTDQLIRSETPDMAVSVSAHLQDAIREFIQELRAKMEVMPLFPEVPGTPERENKTS